MIPSIKIFIATALVFVSAVHAQEQLPRIDNSGAVLLANEGSSPEFDALKMHAQQTNSNSEIWKAFKSANGIWYAQWNVFLPTPALLFGEGLHVPGYSSVETGTAEPAARSGLTELSSILRIRESELQHSLTSFRKGGYTVRFKQSYKNIPVLLSDVIVKIATDGRLYQVENGFKPDIEVDIMPTIDKETAKKRAFKGLKSFEEMAIDALDGDGIRVEGGDLSVLPDITLDGMKYYLVYCFTLYIDETRIWQTFVDAHDGAVRWRFNVVRDGINGHVGASVHKDNVLQTVQTVNLGGMYVTVNGQNATTDANGNFTSSQSGTVTAKLQGPYAKVLNGNGADALVTTTIANGGTFNLEWNDTNSSPAERNAFAHIMRTHSYTKSIDPQFTGMDYQVQATVNKTQDICNAFWDGNGFGFYRVGIVNGVQCGNTAEMFEVVAHEYGHGINSKLYIAQGSQYGMINGSLNEGLADVNPCVILDNPDMGVGFFGPGPLRELDNTRKYPQNVSNDSHITGLIVAGAVWDMKLTVGLTPTRNLVHFAKYDTPDDLDVGTAFTEYLIAILNEDDNDNNLSNGTPNATAIVTAFRLHGIPTSLFTFDHQPVTQASGNVNIPLSTLIEPDFPGVNPSGVKLYYRVKGAGTWSVINLNLQSANPGGPTNWTGFIPPQNNGTLIEYYLEANDGIVGAVPYPSGGASSPFMFPVGFVTKIMYDFELDQGWTGTVAGDNATAGIWERGDPNGTVVTSGAKEIPVQPEDDYSAAGTKCWYTGNAPVAERTNPGQNDVDGGKTTLLSPVFSLANLVTPCIRYWRWFSNDLGASPLDDPWRVQISSNGGTSWKDIENSTDPFNEWRQKFILVSDYVTPSSSMRMRFIARDDAPGSLVEAAVDDVEVLDALPVPVELMNLSARRIDNLIAVDWATASEENNYGFEIQMQREGETVWDILGFVEGNGNSTGVQNYRYEFSETTGSRLLVRLRQIDFDGSYSFSPVIEVRSGGYSFTLHQNYPNPFNPSTSISFELPSAMRATLEISNSYGAVVRTLDLGELAAGAHETAIDMKELPSGVYVYRLQAGGSTQTRRMHLVK